MDGDEAEAVERVAACRSAWRWCRSFLCGRLRCRGCRRSRWGHAQAAVEFAFKALAAGGEKVAGPAVEADAVDEVGGALGGFEVVFAARVVGIADAAVAVAVVDAVLAPDLALADVDALFGGEVALVLGIQVSGDEATADDSRRRPFWRSSAARRGWSAGCFRACRTWARSSRRG